MNSHDTPIADRLLAEVDWARRLARRLVADVATADDVVQEAMAQALAHPPKPGPVRPFLVRVVTNAARMWHRGEGRRRKHEARVAGQRANTLPSTAELVGKAEAHSCLAEAVVQLEEPYRTTVLLRYFEELSSTEIARRLGVPAGTVRWRLSKGLEQLRAVLDRDFGGDSRAWCALLLPLVPGPLGRTAVGGSVVVSASSLTLIGVLMMTVKMTAVLGLCGLVWFTAQALGWGGTDATDPQPSGEVHEQVAFRPIDPPPTEADVSSEASRTEIRAPRPTTGFEYDIQAVVVDESRQPVAGARLRFEPNRQTEDKPTAVSDQNGRVTLHLRIAESEFGSGSSRSADFSIRHPQFASERREVALRRNRDDDDKRDRDGKRDRDSNRDRNVHLGEIVLRPGGAVSGRLVDTSGQAVTGVQVKVSSQQHLEVGLGGAIASRPGQSGDAVSVTGENGAFRLTGLRTGFVRLLAESGERRGRSGLIEVRAGQESFDALVVLLDEPTSADQIRGLVLDPDGKPFGDVRLQCHYTDGRGGNGGRSASVEKDGRFTIPRAKGPFAMKSPRYHLLAEPRAQRFGEAERTDIRMGDFVVLRLKRAQTLRIELRDSFGKAVADAKISLLHTNWRVGNLQHRTAKLDDQGNYVLPMPGVPFKVHASSFGVEAQTFGPYRPADLGVNPAPLRCVLKTVPILRGRVLVAAESESKNGAAARPLPGAEVQLFLRSSFRLIRNGFPVWLCPAPSLTTKSDAEGRFTLTLRHDEPFYLRVGHPGHAITESGPFTLADAGKRHELVLRAGGTIRGSVLPGLADGAPAVAGTIVGISRGDGAARTTRVEADGRFEFEHLTPGKWNVVQRTTEIISGRTEGFSPHGGPFTTVPTNCEVFEGRVTRIDVHVGGATRAPTPAVIRGRIVLGETSLRGFRFVLTPEFRAGAGTPIANGRLDAHGRFEAKVSAAGRYQLIVREPSVEDPLDFGLVVPIEVVSGANAFEFKVPVGTVRGTGVPKKKGSGRTVVLVWKSVGGPHAGALFFTRVQGDDDGAFELTRVPAGRVVFRSVPKKRTPPPAARSNAVSFDHWPGIGKVEVKAGRSVAVDLSTRK